MSILSTALAAVATSLALVAPAAPAPAPAAESTRTVDLSRPGALDRGDDVRVPHQEGTEIVDGDVRVDLGTASFMLMGTSGDDYVVHRWTRRAPRDRILRVTATGERTRLLSGRQSWGATLTSDGGHLITSDTGRRTTLRAYDATDGSAVASARFRGYGWVLDAADGTALVSSDLRSRTLAWRYLDGGRSVVADRAGYHADLGADRIAFFTADPYLDGCTEVAAVSAPEVVLWRSCREKVGSFSPDGQRMVTMHILSDGVGPGEVRQRTTDGTRLVTYTSRWFGLLEWEDADTLLLEAHSRRNGATVRCDLADCERASEVAPSSP